MFVSSLQVPHLASILGSIVLEDGISSSIDVDATTSDVGDLDCEGMGEGAEKSISLRACSSLLKKVSFGYAICECSQV